MVLALKGLRTIMDVQAQCGVCQDRQRLYFALQRQMWLPSTRLMSKVIHGHVFGDVTFRSSFISKSPSHHSWPIGKRSSWPNRCRPGKTERSVSQVCLSKSEVNSLPSELSTHNVHFETKFLFTFTKLVGSVSFCPIEFNWTTARILVCRSFSLFLLQLSFDGTLFTAWTWHRLHCFVSVGATGVVSIQINLVSRLWKLPKQFWKTETGLPAKCCWGALGGIVSSSQTLVLLYRKDRFSFHTSDFLKTHKFATFLVSQES